MGESKKRVIFAHGLESSPEGTKATYLKEIFGAYSPELFHLNLSYQVERLQEVLGERPPNILVGSSLGGLAALGVAKRCPANIARLILLAPAVGVHRRKDAFVAAAKTRPGLHREAEEMSKLMVPKEIPCTVIHGIHDEVVDKSDVIALAENSPSATLILVQDDHMLRRTKSLIISIIADAIAGTSALAG